MKSVMLPGPWCHISEELVNSSVEKVMWVAERREASVFAYWVVTGDSNYMKKHLFLFLWNIWKGTKQWSVFYFGFYLRRITYSFGSCCAKHQDGCSALEWMNTVQLGAGYVLYWHVQLDSILLCAILTSCGGDGDVRALCHTEIIYVVQGRLLGFYFGIQKKCRGEERLGCCTQHG